METRQRYYRPKIFSPWPTLFERPNSIVIEVTYISTGLPLLRRLTTFGLHYLSVTEQSKDLTQRFCVSDKQIVFLYVLDTIGDSFVKESIELTDVISLHSHLMERPLCCKTIPSIYEANLLNDVLTNPCHNVNITFSTECVVHRYTLFCSCRRFFLFLLLTVDTFPTIWVFVLIEKSSHLGCRVRSFEYYLENNYVNLLTFLCNEISE